MSDHSVLRGMTDNYEAYDSGNRFLGLTTVDLPDFNFLTDEVSGPGIMGNLAIPAIGHTESLEITLNWRTITDDAMKFLTPHAHDLKLCSSQHNYDSKKATTLSEPVKIEFRGLLKQSPLGKLEKSVETESKSTFELITLKITIDRGVWLDYDKLNYKFEINGFNYLKDFKKSVGLT